MAEGNSPQIVAKKATQAVKDFSGSREEVVNIAALAATRSAEAAGADDEEAAKEATIAASLAASFMDERLVDENVSPDVKIKLVVKGFGDPAGKDKTHNNSLEVVRSKLSAQLADDVNSNEVFNEVKTEEVTASEAHVVDRGLVATATPRPPKPEEMEPEKTEATFVFRAVEMPSFETKRAVKKIIRDALCKATSIEEGAVLVEFFGGAAHDSMNVAGNLSVQPVKWFMGDRDREPHANCDFICGRNLGVCTVKPMQDLATNRSGSTDDMEKLEVAGLTCSDVRESSRYDALPYVSFHSDCRAYPDSPEEVSRITCSSTAPKGGRRICSCRVTPDFTAKLGQSCSDEMETEDESKATPLECLKHCQDRGFACSGFEVTIDGKCNLRKGKLSFTVDAKSDCYTRSGSNISSASGIDAKSVSEGEVGLASNLWPVYLQNHTRCRPALPSAGEVSPEVPEETQIGCQRRALAAGHVFYEWDRSRKLCYTTPECEKPRSTTDPWVAFRRPEQINEKGTTAFLPGAGDGRGAQTALTTGPPQTEEDADELYQAKEGKGGPLIARATVVIPSDRTEEEVEKLITEEVVNSITKRARAIMPGNYPGPKLNMAKKESSSAALGCVYDTCSIVYVDGAGSSQANGFYYPSFKKCRGTYPNNETYGKDFGKETYPAKWQGYLNPKSGSHFSWIWEDTEYRGWAIESKDGKRLYYDKFNRQLSRQVVERGFTVREGRGTAPAPKVKCLPMNRDNHPLMFYGAKLYVDLLGRYEFDGLTYYDLADKVPTSLGGQFTVMFTAKWNELKTPTRIFDFGVDMADNNILVGNVGETPDLQMTVYRDAEEFSIVVPDVIEIGRTRTWLMTLTKDSRLKVWRDGTLVGETQPGTAHMPRNIWRPTFYIGRSLWPNDNLFNGTIQDFRMWTGECYSWGEEPFYVPGVQMDHLMK
eukprot:TRINITY_DN29338_c0_g1_i1.p1 TRINITY_DN29338_c0_g1~~TRINITY_DN29338_c0_g1_i1.p1  ORF type:complete len:1050 (+),score=225.24 TRINITY_DN29338_c0_g1_i1:346-3150(+)